MFVLYVLYNEGQKAQPGQCGKRSTDKVQRTKQNSNRGLDICLFLSIVRVARERSLETDQSSSRGVIPTVVCLTECV